MIFWMFSATLALGNWVGSDFQTFSPTADGLDFVTVQSGSTLSPSVWNLGLFGNYALNAVPEFDANDEPVNYSFNEIRNRSLFSDLNGAYGLSEGWQIQFNLPAILSQSIDAKTNRIDYDARGFNELRLGLKNRLWGSDEAALASILSLSQNFVENNPYIGEGSSMQFLVELAAHYKVGTWTTGLNAGYRMRRPGAPIPGTPLTPLGPQWLGSAAVAKYFESLDSKLVFELTGGSPANRRRSNDESLQEGLEALLGLKNDLNYRTALHAGITAGLVETAGTPDARIYFGVNMTFGGEDPKKESVVTTTKPNAEAAIASYEVPTPGPGKTYVLPTVNFQFDSDREILSRAVPELDAFGKYIADNKDQLSFILEGHTDSVGSDTYNLDLSRRRAAKIQQYFVRMFKISPERLPIEFYGESKPVADNANYQGRQRNRRVELRVVGK